METQPAGWMLVVRRVVESAALLFMLGALIFSP
jgi:hypothetical protein